MKIRPIEKDEGDYACAPCWLKSQREVEATVFVERSEKNDWFVETPMCANHAELLDVQQEEKK